MRKLSGFYCLLFIVLCLFSCKKNSSGQGTDTPGTKLAVYIAKEFAGMDFKDPSSTWCYPRSRESAHFIVFWDKKYGTTDPNSSSVPASYRVDIDDLLVKAESFYRMNVDTLKFAETGKGKSNGTMKKNAAGTIDFIVPANCARLWFIVTGAPSVYTPHAWDDNNTNDEQWPYELTFTNTELL